MLTIFAPTEAMLTTELLYFRFAMQSYNFFLTLQKYASKKSCYHVYLQELSLISSEI